MHSATQTIMPKHNSKKIKDHNKAVGNVVGLFHKDFGTSVPPVHPLSFTLFHNSSVTPFCSTDHLNEVHLWSANHILGTFKLVTPTKHFDNGRKICHSVTLFTKKVKIGQ
jgi:hypothetical protein